MSPDPMGVVIGLPQWIVLAVAAQRIAELAYARRNTARLRARGGREHGAGHYPLFILLHGGWLVALFLMTPPDAPIAWPLIGVFVLLQAARIWVIASLGPYWSTRIITVPDAPLVRRGPYRFVRHPNYLVVAAEIAVLPPAFDPLSARQWAIALVFTVLNALLLRHRIRIEEAALAGRA